MSEKDFSKLRLPKYFEKKKKIVLNGNQVGFHPKKK